MLEFKQVIGIDWSGSQGYQRGDDGEYPIQVATCDLERRELRLEDAVEIHNPLWQVNRWSRTTVSNWLLDQISQQASVTNPVLVGLDFSFSFPFADLGRYFPEENPETGNWNELTELIGQTVGEDFNPDSFVTHDFYRRFFKIPRTEGNNYQLRYRLTEQMEYLYGQRPASVYKLIGGDQVGRGTIAGIAFLRHLRSELNEAIHVWPLDGAMVDQDVRAVVVEVWPRMLYEMVGVPPNAHRYPLVFELALRQCAITNTDVRPSGENTGDALITAAVLARFFEDKSIWQAPAQLGAQEFPLEGWIWGARATA